MLRVVTIIICYVFCLDAIAQINIWEGSNVKKNVELMPFVAEGDDNVAVIVCPGGSYFWHDTETEGYDVAEWLQRNGVSAFVLNYRTACFPAYITHFRLLFRGNRYPDPQDDLRRAILYLRQNARQYRIAPNRIGAMGFSAGGHLVMSAAELFEKEDRPAFVAPIYPVVTMAHESVHRRSRRGLLGDSKVRNERMRDLLSLERHVPDDCPPVFLVNCKDDPVVDYRNSELLDSALTARKVPHVYIQYETGGHGFGVCETDGTEECRAWKLEFLEWLNKIYEYDKKSKV